ncbi:TPA: asparagine synthase [Stenotrophomonas maltophilia]|nr:asparagine synthase [Stenotrophomonas maltophilia]
MSIRYFIFVGAEGATTDAGAQPLRIDGLHEVRLDSDGEAARSMRIFASEETPTLPVPGIGVLIGQVFRRDGTPVTDGRALAQSIGDGQPEKVLLKDYWGEYILLHVSEGRSVGVLRDPSGAVPCVYLIREGTGFITSSISIAEHAKLYARRVDWESMVHWLTYPYLRMQRTGLLDVRELLPGDALTLQGASVTVRSAWSPWDHVAERRYADGREAAADVRHVVSTAVKAWAEKDRSVLLELSGGLDSSIVAACLRGVDAQVACCTIMAPVPGTDERLYAKQMASYLGTELQTVDISFQDARFDFPVSPDAVLPGMGILHYAVDRAMDKAGAAHGAASYFSGGGGDSIFCYLKGASPAADAFKERGLAAALTAIRELAALHQCTLWKAGRLTLKKLRRGAKAPSKSERLFLNPGLGLPAMERHPWFDAPSDTLPGDREKVYDLIGSQSYRDGMLRTEHRPIRFPLLSQLVMETCLRVPTWMWIAGGVNRSVARTAFADCLPADIRNRRSKGTYISYCGALYTRNKLGMLAFLANGKLRTRGLLDFPLLEKYIRADLAPEDLFFVRVFDLCMVENWLQRQT